MVFEFWQRFQCVHNIQPVSRGYPVHRLVLTHLALYRIDRGCIFAASGVLRRCLPCETACSERFKETHPSYNITL